MKHSCFFVQESGKKGFSKNLKTHGSIDGSGSSTGMGNGHVAYKPDSKQAKVKQYHDDSDDVSITVLKD